MANQDWGFGLQPAKKLHNDAPDTTRYALKDSLATAVYKGQIVIWSGTNTASSTDGVYGNETTNTAANIIGVSAEYYAGSATTKTHLAVWDASEYIFQVQSDDSTGSRNFVKEYLLKNFVLVGPAGGNTVSGLSTSELDFSSGLITAADHPLRVVELSGDVNNDDISSANPNVLVRFIHGAPLEQDTTVT